ncbi:hypothetical protein TNCV_3830781 [Trichonephila clavipes]|nr:hypothetical protein TNCV_3830781 [Trichonephila clavipes]
MALPTDHTTEMEYQNVSLPPYLEKIHRNHRPDQLHLQGSKLRRQTSTRYTLIVQGYENMIAALRHSNAQD